MCLLTRSGHSQTIVPGTMLGRLVSSRADLDIQSAYASDITLTPGLGGRVLVHSETEYALRAGGSSMRVTTDMVNITTPYVHCCTA